MARLCVVGAALGLQLACDQVAAVASWDEPEAVVPLPFTEGGWMVRSQESGPASDVVVCCEAALGRGTGPATYDIACLHSVADGPLVMRSEPMGLQRVMDAQVRGSQDHADDVLLSDLVHLFPVSGQAFSAPSGQEGFLLQVSTNNMAFGAAPAQLPVRLLPREDGHGYDAAILNFESMASARPKLTLVDTGKVTLVLDDTKRLRRWMAANWTRADAWRPVELTQVTSCSEQFPSTQEPDSPMP